MAQRPSKVKDKRPAPVQITAEQILREAKERTAPQLKIPKQKISDKEELDEYKLAKRKQFEDAIRRNRTQVPTWMKARSIFERALEADHRNTNLWMKYAEMEMKLKNVNMARNIFDRAVAVLPRIDQFWYKYTYMEETLENVAGARQVFERWMEWEPPEEAWMAYIKMERRYGEIERARTLHQRFVSVHPEPKNWLKWAKFEENIGKIDRARAIYEQCIEALGEELIDQNVWVSFAKFETRQKEIDRARAIYKYSLDRLPKGQRENLYNVYTQFEKQFGAKEGIEDVVTAKRRVKYEEASASRSTPGYPLPPVELASNPKNYDVWFDYVKLEESNGDVAKIREVYERSIGQLPPINEKRFWRRYIYLWIFYAVWEELETKDHERTKEVYIQCLKTIPHKTFTFAKVWLLYAQYLIRQGDLDTARKTLGAAIGMCPKQNLFKGYIELEVSLREFDRARKLYERYLEWNPANCVAWIKFSELELQLGDVDRSRGIYEIAVSQPSLDMPEVLWKAYIDFEVEQQEWQRVRDLYSRLLERTEHVKVWISFANSEMSAMDHPDDATRISKARAIFEKGHAALKAKDAREERVILLEAWREYERSLIDNSTVQNDTELKKIEARMPKVVKKRRRVMDPISGEPAGWEEHYDFIFPEDDKDKPSFKLLSMAQKWKMQQALGNDDDDEDDEDEDEDEDEDAVDTDGKLKSTGIGKWEQTAADDADEDDEEE
ncbi:hypothetical protein SmJEL517_g00707 [Synchytrium microbalum]|uniref:Pre-mRNA-splicing factor Syf1/CRNKL1-like C-terminal HAT-repeats domain-containing protein n=1 Tax=Synchytrium microbalum TaxID=1806994 RepID=A0A507CHD8_9FUNG|nr:uncharacterized protein SmJEL517_g00707 [Synchytrium microbalum]TPX37486.1 hypothetical protein SmJEL517_g00707 [Synchytrium microbalum]